MRLPYVKPDAYCIEHPEAEPPPQPTTVLQLRVVVRDLFDHTLSRIHPGEMNLTDGSATVDTAATLETITWGTLTPEPGRFHKFWALPTGGFGVGKNSVAATVERSSGSNAFTGRRDSARRRSTHWDRFSSRQPRPSAR